MSEKIEKENPLATEPAGKLIAKFAIPAIISMLVSSLYNIVDQIFIGQGVGMLGNAATNIAFPISIICTATALLLGIGSASNFNLESGAGNSQKAARIAATGLSMLAMCGVIIAVVVLLFLDPILNICGVTPDVLPYAQDYENRPYLKLGQLTCADVDADLSQCGLAGSPTKVKNVENIVFKAKESKVLTGSDEDVNGLIQELLASHTLG